MIFSAVISKAPIRLDMGESTEEGVIIATAGLVTAGSEVVDEAGFQRAVLERQRILPPLMGNGVALPHARTSLVREIVFAMAKLREPVPFGKNHAPIRLVFLYGVPPTRVAEHLAMMATLTRKLRDPKVIEALLAAPDEETFRQVLL